MAYSKGSNAVAFTGGSGFPISGSCASAVLGSGAVGPRWTPATATPSTPPTYTSCVTCGLSKASHRSSARGAPAWILRSQYLMTHTADDKSPSKTKMHTKMVHTFLVPVDLPLWQWATAHLSLRAICPTGGSLAYFSRSLGLASSCTVTSNVTVSTSLEPGLCCLDALYCYHYDDCVVFFPLHHHDHKTFPGGLMHFKKLLQNMGECGLIFPRNNCTCSSSFAQGNLAHTGMVLYVRHIFFERQLENSCSCDTGSRAAARLTWSRTGLQNRAVDPLLEGLQL